jgi:signal transduction histidine kinase
MKKFFEIFFLLPFFLTALCLPSFLWAQENRSIDSLKQLIKKIPADSIVQKAKELIKLGQQFILSSNYTAAMDSYQQSLTIAQNIKNDSLQAGCYTGLAVIAYYQQDYDKDSSYMFKALKIYRNLRDTLHEGRILKNIAATYAQRGDLQQANKYFEQASAIFRKLNQVKLEAGIYSNMAAMYRWDFRKSIELELKAKKIWDKDPNDGVLPTANVGNLGIYYFYLVKFDSLNSIKHDSLISASPLENLKKAEAYLRQAIQMAEQNNDINNESHYTGELAELQEYTGNYKDAYLNMQKYHQIHDSLFSQENKNQIAALESRHEIDKKNQEIEKQKLNVQAQKKNILLLLLSLLTVVVIGFLYYRLSVVRREKNKELTQLNEQLDKANKVKAKFFGIISHDLRSPVANLISFLELQKRKPGIMNEVQIADRENKITSSAKSLLETMDAMLLWSKGQMEHFKPDISAVEINNAFNYLRKFFEGISNLQISFSNEENLIVQTDENFLRCIMQNLTANAVKALRQTTNAQVSWKAWREQNNIFLSITDNGHGANEEQLKALYDETVSSGAKHGLGLHIIRDLAKAIGCTITLNTQKSQGAQFILNIPSKHLG